MYIDTTYKGDGFIDNRDFSVCTMKEITLEEDFHTRLFHSIYLVLSEVNTPKGIQDEDDAESFL